MEDTRAFKLMLLGLLGSIVVVMVIALATPDWNLPPESSFRSEEQGPDSLDAELERCRTLRPDQEVDVRCRDAWAESGRRFFGNDHPGR